MISDAIWQGNISTFNANSAYMRPTGSGNPNNCTAITRAGDNVVMSEPEKHKQSISNEFKSNMRDLQGEKFIEQVTESLLLEFVELVT